MIILDTSFLVSYYNKRDKKHPASKEIMKRIIGGIYGEACISDYIFDECSTVLMSRLNNLKEAIELCGEIKGLITLKVDEELFEKSWQVFKKQENTSFSFTDCSILSFMSEERINYLATFDEEFKKVKEIMVVDL